jgi:hypothetical protein
MAGLNWSPHPESTNGKLHTIALERRWLVDRLPNAWRKKVMADELWSQWLGASSIAFAECDALAPAVALGRAVVACPYPVHSTESDVREYARRGAEACMRLARTVQGDDEGAWGARRAVLAGFCDARGVRVQDCGDRPACARMACELWWRRGVRRCIASHLERAAIGFGFVHRRASAYLSGESYARWLQQQRSNARMMARVELTNADTGESASLASLAATSVANPINRRGELMTRIRGFEEIAQREGHTAVFITVTCPSRMHARHGATGERNEKYDGTTPREAQSYLSNLWARARSALARRNVIFYGFRVAEPHHDGCPHWHLLLFVAECEGVKARADGYQSGSALLVATIQGYALADSPDERGAQEYRVRVVKMDAGKGTASSYIAKYIAKGVGTLDGDDLFDGVGGDEHKPRAWASTWRIRQFQQIGGPPVGVWRELRRVSVDQIPAIGGDPVMAAAWSAVNREGERRACWRSYVDAVGGWAVTTRSALCRLVSKTIDGLTRYGESRSPVPCGVSSPYGMVESKRDVWVAAPWTRVNNCTAELRGILSSIAKKIEKGVGYAVSDVVRDRHGGDLAFN